eukprot:CAMPEP_0114244542 /NCGR_PEP_ID=MMETSP0058-20121206/11395_1 /TAXON_ID=36894 /ORGANISM="Pyramimonas parkeae, CCMP726" /LENGTH=565 /DNA_ID=CAMNT_0001357489 /DNA_START=146 /DNA_END=1840 /DNA_ORIENTATION=-
MIRSISFVFLGMLFAGGQSATINWCDGETPGSPSTVTAVHGQVYRTTLWEDVCIPLCVYIPPPPPPSPFPPPSPSPPPLPDAEQADRVRRQLLQSAEEDAVGVRQTELSESFPVVGDPNFPYPFDEVNYPPTGAITGNFSAVSSTMPYCFGANSMEECVYTVCFQGVSKDGTHISTDVRCFRIEVVNEVLTFDGDDEAQDEDVSKMLTPTDGLTFSAFVYPACTGTAGFNQSVMYFGSIRDFASQSTEAVDAGYEIRNGIKWSVSEGFSAEEGRGQFMYYDCDIGAVASPAQYACDVWHFVAVTISGTAGNLYVDGISPGKTIPSSRDLHTFSISSFNTTLRPDNSMDNANAGVFKMGHYPEEGFVGSLDEVRVHNYALSPSKIYSEMITRSHLKSATELLDPLRLKLYLTMSSITMEGKNMPALSAGAPTVNISAIPPMTPCVLGMEHNVGPVDGMCRTKVYGWSFSDSVNPQCSFAGVQGSAIWESDSVLSCSTPGHFSPRFVDVLASNNGVNFTDVFYVNKQVRHLYMESSLYVQAGSGGASADQVCADLTTDSQAVTVSAW